MNEVTVRFESVPCGRTCSFGEAGTRSDRPFPLLMGGHADALRSKLLDSRGELRRRWDHFLALARGDAEWFGCYQPLAYLVTRDAAFKRLARRTFTRFVEEEPESDLSIEAQFHTHVVAAPLGRLVAQYDWIADLGVLSPSEDKAFAATAIDHAMKFPLQQLHGRAPGYDNQVMSNAFACAAVGFMFGMRRGADPVARRMFDVGFAWLRRLLGKVPLGGYSLEGSTYNDQVAIPVTLWSTLLCEEVTGESIFDDGLPPNRQGVRKMLRVLARSIGPGGLLPPWDAYGYMRSRTRCQLVYLARRCGDSSLLRLIRETRSWERLDHPAWECDDRVWTLVWWPEGQAAEGTAEFPAWMEPMTAGALQHRASQTRLFQYWDECGGLFYSGRAEVNPNAISLEAHGVPLLLDGVGEIDESLMPRPTGPIVDYAGRQRMEDLAANQGLSGEQGLSTVARQAVAGCVGLSNSLILDGEDWYVPRGPAHGEGVACHEVGPLQVLSSEAVDYYRDRYDVSEVRRTSVLAEGRWCVVLDRVRSATDHEVTWQVFVPAGATAEGTTVEAASPDGTELQIVPAESITPALDPAPDFPRSSPLGRGSTRVRYSSHTRKGEYSGAFCLVPHASFIPDEKLTGDLNARWEANYGGHKKRIDLRDAMLLDPCTNTDRPRTYSRRIRISDPTTHRRLRVACGVTGLVCRANGQDAPSCIPAMGEVWETASSTTIAHVFDLSGLLRKGENLLELEAPFFHGETAAGPVELLRPAPSSPNVGFRRISSSEFEVDIDGVVDRLLLDNDGACGFAGTRTDACHALVSAEGDVSVAGATFLTREDEIGISSLQPMDAALRFSASDGVPEITIGPLADCNVVTLRLPAGELRIDTLATLIVRWSGRSRIRLRLRGDYPRPVTVNGKSEKRLEPGTWREFTLGGVRRGRGSADRRIRSATSAYAAAQSRGSESEETLVAASQSEDWRTALAAVDALASIGTAAAGPRLLALLESEAERPAEAEMVHRWSYSKMLREHDEPLTLDLPAPAPQDVKRWRLRRALVTALGRIGYKPAAPLLQRLTEDGQDYFAVGNQLSIALARLDAREALPVLEGMWDHQEINTQRHARLAVRYLRGEIGRAQFEAQIGPA